MNGHPAPRSLCYVLLEDARDSSPMPCSGYSTALHDR